jgi:DNA sulfur modification protein DndB
MQSENMETLKSAISLGAVRGKQGLGDYFLVNIPFSLLREIPIMKYPDDAPAKEKAQRALVKSHARALRDYLVKEPDAFLPTLTASLVKGDADDDLIFVPSSEKEELKNIGTLFLPMGFSLLPNDGQHRLEGALQAINQEASLADRTLPMLLLPDYSLQVSQKVFYLIHAKQKPVSTSMQVAYNSLEPESNFANDLIQCTPFLLRHTDGEKTSVSGKKNPNLFTLALIRKLGIIMRNDTITNHQKSLEYCSTFFNVLADVIPHWAEILDRRIDAPSIRQEYVTTQAVTLEAFAELACELRDEYSKKLNELNYRLKPLRSIDWEKTNPDWEGRILNISSKDGNIVYKMLSKKDNVTRMKIYLKLRLGLPITSEEYALEKIINPIFCQSIPSNLLPKVIQMEITDFLASAQPTIEETELDSIEESTATEGNPIEEVAPFQVGQPGQPPTPPTPGEVDVPAVTEEPGVEPVRETHLTNPDETVVPAEIEQPVTDPGVRQPTTSEPEVEPTPARATRKSGAKKLVDGDEKTEPKAVKTRGTKKDKEEKIPVGANV